MGRTVVTHFRHFKDFHVLFLNEILEKTCRACLESKDYSTLPLLADIPAVLWENIRQFIFQAYFHNELSLINLDPPYQSSAFNCK